VREEQCGSFPSLLFQGLFLDYLRARISCVCNCFTQAATVLAFCSLVLGLFWPWYAVHSMVGYRLAVIFTSTAMYVVFYTNVPLLLSVSDYCDKHHHCVLICCQVWYRLWATMDWHKVWLFLNCLHLQFGWNWLCKFALLCIRLDA